MGKYNILGERIKSARLKLEMSQGELAQQLNCTQAALSQYERGSREPGLGDLVNIANALNTSTDYLLGRTDVLSQDTSIRNIGDYLGLNEEAIDRLHSMYIRRKSEIDEDRLQEEVKFYSGAVPTDESYAKDYSFVKQNSQQDLDDYQKTLNEFICSREFRVLISGLMNNLFLERSVYDLMRIVDKQYDKIETCFSTDNPAEQAFSIASDGENFVKQYSLNMFEIQTAIMDFCQHFTRLEEIKKLEQTENLYRKIVFHIYCATCSMFENGHYSVKEMEMALNSLCESVGPQIKELLRNS